MEHVTVVLVEAEKFAKVGDITNMYQVLRKMPLADYCMLHLNPPTEYAALTRVLPKIPSESVQMKWVGDFGRSLMSRSCSLLRLFDLISWRLTGSGLENKKILDYGCGWGRLLRLMNYYSDPGNVCGIDAMPESLRICAEAGIHNKTWLIGPRPGHENSAKHDTDFDFAYLFSVFSHTPEEVTVQILRYICGLTKSNAIVIATIRTIDWLVVRENVWPNELILSLRNSYSEHGYGFVPMNGEKGALDEADYGDTIMTTNYFSGIAEQAGWKIVGIDRDVLEPFQICVALKKSGK